jgi:cyclophilin family peptidyl-prolyl cis-trans isomerase
MLTLDSLPTLDGSDHTIFGRLISGRETVNMIEGMDEFKRLKVLVEAKEERPTETKVLIKNAGVYKFENKEQAIRKKSAAGVYDFKPDDFFDARKNK